MGIFKLKDGRDDYKYIFLPGEGTQDSPFEFGLSTDGTDNTSTPSQRAKKFPLETLNAPGSTSALDIFNFSRITCHYKVTNINGSVYICLEGVGEESFDWVNLDPSEEDTFIDSDGSYMFCIDGILLSKVRFSFVSGNANISVSISAGV